MYGYNSTINRKKKACKSCGLPKYIFSKGRCQDCARVEDTMNRMERDSERIIGEEDLSELVGQADTIFSKFIRLKYSDGDGKVSCYTCGDVKHWTLQQNGHYIKRGNLFLRFDERNCRPQCETCNCHKHGNMGEFTQRLEKESPGITDILKEESVLVYKPTRDEIRTVIKEYTQKVKILLTSKKQK